MGTDKLNKDKNFRFFKLCKILSDKRRFFVLVKEFNFAAKVRDYFKSARGKTNYLHLFNVIAELFL